MWCLLRSVQKARGRFMSDENICIILHDSKIRKQYSEHVQYIQYYFHIKLPSTMNIMMILMCFLLVQYISWLSVLYSLRISRLKQVIKSLNPLSARVFLKKCWILTSRFQKLVAWKGLKIEIYCKLEKCWAWPKVYVGCKYTHLICILWRQQGGGPLEFHNIQEIVDIKLMFELICMFVCFFVFLSSFQMIRKEEINNKIGESTKLLLYYYPI